MPDPDAQGERFRRIEAVFAQVCDLPAGKREARIDELCAGDAPLAHEVRGLIAADCAANIPGGRGLDHAALNLKDLSLDDLSIDELTREDAHLPERIGPFEIVGLLGEGGMGVVYEAVQRSPRRTVALKVIRQRSLHARIRRRFEAEADILARLHHPGIATIYESGVAGEGRRGTPYVAMELIRGLPITQYARTNDLSVDQRVALMRRVCRAVAHAHAMGIVHRDLKPTNILVDESGGPHVLDFGIAIDLGAEQRTQLTQSGQLLGTLQYMAPEQVDTGGKDAVGAGTDVYALGLICYELLTGEHPYAKHDSSMYELVCAIRDEEADRLGTHDRALRGDIETIISKALAREPARRYPDAAALGDELDRYLQHKPIEARPPSTWYQLRRFTQRNPVLVGSVATVMLVMALALVLIGRALREANTQRELAQRDQQIKAMVNEFMTQDLFATADAAQGGDPDITLLGAMLKAAGGVRERFADAPEVEAEVSATMGRQLRVMNQYGAAQKYLERSVELSQQLDLDISTIVDRRNELTKLYSDLDQLDHALEYMNQTEAMMHGRKGLKAQTRIDTLISHGSLLFHMGRTEGSEPYFRRAVALGRRELPGDEWTYSAIGDLALVLTRLGRFDEAVSLSTESNEYSARVLGPDHPDTLIGIDNLGLLYMQMGRFDKAHDVFSENLATRLRVLGPDHSRTHITEAMLGRALTELGEYDRAGPILIRGYEGLADVMGADHRYTTIARNDLVRYYEATGQTELADRYRQPEQPAP